MDIKPAIISRASSLKAEPDKHDRKLITNVSGIVSGQKGIVLAVDASHTGYVNDNWRNYTRDSFRKKYSTFHVPYPAPILRGHNLVPGVFGPDMTEADALGRVYDSAFVPGEYPRPDKQVADGLLKVGVFIPDSEDAEKIRDGRHLTTSIGFSFASKKCSICGFDWYMYAQTGKGFADGDSDEEEVCEHSAGKMYGKRKNQPCFYHVDVREFRELSMTVSPADRMALIKAYAEVGGDSISNPEDYVDVEYMTDAALNYCYQDVNYRPGFVVGDKAKKAIGSSGTSDDGTGDNSETETDVMDKLNEQLDELKGAISGLSDQLKPLTGLADVVSSLNDTVKGLKTPVTPSEPEEPAEDTSSTSVAEDGTISGNINLKDIIGDAVQEAVKAVLGTVSGSAQSGGDGAEGDADGVDGADSSEESGTSSDGQVTDNAVDDKVKALEEQVSSLTEERDSWKDKYDELEKRQKTGVSMRVPGRARRIAY